MAFQEILEFRSPTRLLHGPGALSRLPELLPSGTRILLVTDEGLREAGVIDMVAAVLDEAEVDCTVFSGVLPNPPASCVEEGARIFSEQECGALLGVGGGSPMDVAKMIGVLASHGGRIEEYLMAPGKITRDIPPLVCVPTTYGTGSEVTPFAVLTNPASRNKDPVVSWRIAPRAGVLDAALCTALPAAVGGPTGMDALTHAIESYTNLMASPASDGMALEAMRLIGENLRLACANDYETEATQSMLLASAMAGIAFSQTRLGNVHAMSHPVGAQFGVHHGLANAVLLPYVMEFNLPSRTARFADVAGALGGDADGLGDQEAARLAVKLVRQLNEDLGIPEKLGTLGVEESGIEDLSEAAMQSANIQVNPRKTARRDVEGIFRQAI